jgi:hypothetical protein
MYNGATGEQIKAVIFIGPVYGMRLKHMVEDKWQARGQGRKEVRTHQPTGGRGAQGGLKIGEMDRDAIIAHGGMSFVRESFMERSDGTKIPICVACGTIPIYNPKLNISICALCDGPVRFIGDNINNLEILPPLGRPKSKIVEVAMPYSTKLLTQEQETYLNMTMRYITTSGVTRLNQLEYSGVSSEIVKELPRLILPETVAPAYIEDVPKATVSVEQLRSMGATVNTLTEEEKRNIDIVIDPEIQLQQEFEQFQPQQEFQPQPQEFQQVQPLQQVQQPQFQPQQVQQVQQPQQFQQVQQPQFQPQPQEFQPQPQQFQQPQPMMGGFQEGLLAGPSVPGLGPLISVRTDSEAMMMEGLVPGRQIRRNPFKIPGGANPSETAFKFIKME